MLLWDVPAAIPFFGPKVTSHPVPSFSLHPQVLALVVWVELVALVAWVELEFQEALVSQVGNAPLPHSEPVGALHGCSGLSAPTGAVQPGVGAAGKPPKVPGRCMAQMGLGAAGSASGQVLTAAFLLSHRCWHPRSFPRWRCASWSR